MNISLLAALAHHITTLSITFMTQPFHHFPVLCAEAVNALVTDQGGYYVDATFGRGGHTAAILADLNPSAHVLALDRDPDAAAYAAQAFAQEPRLHFVHSSFGRLAALVTQHVPEPRVDGVLLDLGVSSPQLDNPERGFSFRHDGPLDMRMDTTTGISVADWLATVTETELAEVLRDYGEERFHRRIARAIVTDRQHTPFTRTRPLAELIERVIPNREPGQHPATRSFQALRIKINHELDELALVLEQAVQVLRPGGRLVVISFHSLEDRMVKRFFRREMQGADLPPDLPIPTQSIITRLRTIGKPQRPSAAEAQRNPRARSAVLRVAERLS